MLTQLQHFSSLYKPRYALRLSIISYIFLIVSTAGCTANVPLDKPMVTPLSTPATTQFTYFIRVIDKATDQPISNAKVILELSKLAALDGITDVHGYTRIEIPSHYHGKPSTIISNMDEYEPYRKEIDLYEGLLPDVIRLNELEMTPTLIPTQTPVPTLTQTATADFTVTPIPSSTRMITPTLQPAVILLPAKTVTSTVVPTPYSFFDDFDGNIFDDEPHQLKPEWEVVGGSDQWVIENNRLEIENDKISIDGPSIQLLIGSPEATNYIVSLKVGSMIFYKNNRSLEEIIGLDINRYDLPKFVTIKVHYQDNGQNVLFAILSYHYGCLVYNETGTYKKNQGFHSEGLFNDVFDVRIIVKDNFYAFYINNVKMCSFYNRSFSSGRVELQLYRPRHQDLWIDDFTLTMID